MQVIYSSIGLTTILLDDQLIAIYWDNYPIKEYIYNVYVDTIGAVDTAYKAF